MPTFVLQMLQMLNKIINKTDKLTLNTTVMNEDLKQKMDIMDKKQSEQLKNLILQLNRMDLNLTSRLTEMDLKLNTIVSSTDDVFHVPDYKEVVIMKGFEDKENGYYVWQKFDDNQSVQKIYGNQELTNLIFHDEQNNIYKPNSLISAYDLVELTNDYNYKKISRVVLPKSLIPQDGRRYWIEFYVSFVATTVFYCKFKSNDFFTC